MGKGLKASRRGAVDSFLAMDMLHAANRAESSGVDVIHMEVGQPAARPPSSVMEFARQALNNERIGYTEALGMPKLRERIAQHYRTEYGIDIGAERVVVTTGSSAGFILAFLAAFDAGDRVALTNPGYPAYRNILASLGLKAAYIDVGAGNGWAPDCGDLEQLYTSGVVNGLLLASPANPTGSMLSAERLKKLVDICQGQESWFISDEIYHGLTYGAPATTALQFSDDAIVINSFSKYYCMTGWRIGWMIVPPILLSSVERLAQNLFISAPALSQHAAMAAFDAKADLETIKEGYAANRSLLLNELPSLGLDDLAPADGAFYIYADVSRFCNDSFGFAQKMLKDIGVAVTPGADFDPEQGQRFIRLSFAGTQDHMRQACDRLRAFLKK